MPKLIVTVSIEKDLVLKPDRLVSEGKYAGGSSAVEDAVSERIIRVEKNVCPGNWQSLIPRRNRPWQTRG